MQAIKLFHLNLDLDIIQPSTSQTAPSLIYPSASEQWLSFVAKWYDYPDISRQRSLEIINDVRDFLNNFINETVQIIFAPEINLQINEKTVKEKTVEQIQCLIQNFRDEADKLNTEHNIFHQFEKSENLILPELYLLGERQDFTRRDEKRT